MQNKIYKKTKSELDSIVSGTQETSEIMQLYHSAMQEYIDLWKLYTGVQDPKLAEEYHTVKPSPEVFNATVANKKKTEQDFYIAAVSIGHADLMGMFAGAINHKITQHESFIGLKNAILVGRGNDFFEPQDIAVSVLYQMSGLENSFGERLFYKEFKPEQILYISQEMGFDISEQEAFEKGNAALQERILQVIEKNVMSSKTSKEAYKKNENLAKKIWDTSLDYREPVLDPLYQKTHLAEALNQK